VDPLRLGVHLHICEEGVGSNPTSSIPGKLDFFIFTLLHYLGSSNPNPPVKFFFTDV
jgi:hypothetical protein